MEKSDKGAARVAEPEVHAKAILMSPLNVRAALDDEYFRGLAFGLLAGLMVATVVIIGGRE